MINRQELRRQHWGLVLVSVFMIAGTGSGRPLSPSSRQAEHDPLRSVLHLRIDDPADPGRRNLRLDQAKVLPLKAGDRFRIESRLNRAAYLYLFWVGSDAKVAPIYPWRPGHWDKRPADERKLDRLDLPAQADKAWEIPAGRLGIETLLLLVREDSPLPRKDEKSLARLLSGAHVGTEILIKEAVWLENGREITIDPQDRAIPSSRARKSDDPVLGIRRLLEENVRPLGDYYQAIVFPNQGGRKVAQIGSDQGRVNNSAGAEGRVQCAIGGNGGRRGFFEFTIGIVAFDVFH
jgi:hypothetical protein